MRAGKVAPFILVAPRTTLLPGVDTGCANVPGTVNADSWLSIDVPKMVRDNFRAQPAPKGWAVAGYSAGGHCAAKLAVAHPDRYRAAVSLSGYSDPIVEPDSLAAQSPALRRANNPYLLLRRASVPPPVALYLSGQPKDGYEAALALRQEAKAPTAVHVVYIPSGAGGHTMALWRPQVVPAFRWLTTQLGQRPVTADAKGKATTPRAPSSADSKHAALASGTASRAAAARRP
jgi:S-formylglutathione hydrolase FrmB